MTGTFVRIRKYKKTLLPALTLLGKFRQLWVEITLGNKAASGYLKRYKPFSKKHKRIFSTCVVANAIPKSGTYLLHQIFKCLQLWEDIHIHINPHEWTLQIPGKDIVVYHDRGYDALQRIRNGQMIGAHLSWSREIEQVTADTKSYRHIRHVFLYRDPRDTMVSYMNFATYSDKYPISPSQREHQRFLRENFSNDDERLAHIIKERLEFPFLDYAPWLTSPLCYAVRFEDLYPDILNLQQGTVGKYLTDILGFVGVSPAHIDPIEFFQQVYGQGRTASNVERKIGQYKHVFKDEHYALIDNPKFRHIISAFGYEW